MIQKTKVISYIFRNKRTEVLVFDHEIYPEAGTQVIGGTLEAGEGLNIALAREIFEESGLAISPDELWPIGETTFYRTDRAEVNFRNYFGFDSLNLLDQWTHMVKSDGEDNGLAFNFFWLSLDEAKSCLVGQLGECLTFFAN